MSPNPMAGGGGSLASRPSGMGSAPQLTAASGPLAPSTPYGVPQAPGEGAPGGGMIPPGIHPPAESAFLNPMSMGAPPWSMGVPNSPYAPGYAPPVQVGQITSEGSHMLGLSVLAVGAGSLIGWQYGGMYGSIAGGLIGGAAVNGWRAIKYFQEGSEDADREAAIAATYAVLTTAIGGYLIATKARRPGEECGCAVPNPDDDEALEVVPTGPCSARTVGPSILPPDEDEE